MALSVRLGKKAGAEEEESDDKRSWPRACPIPTPMSRLAVWIGSNAEFLKMHKEVVDTLRAYNGPLKVTANGLRRRLESDSPKWCFRESQGLECSNPAFQGLCCEWHIKDYQGFILSADLMYDAVRDIVAYQAMEKKRTANGACTHLLAKTTCSYIDPVTGISKCWKAHPAFEFQFANWKGDRFGICIYDVVSKCRFSEGHKDDECPCAHAATEAQRREWFAAVQTRMTWSPESYPYPERIFFAKYLPKHEQSGSPAKKDSDKKDNDKLGNPELRALTNRFSMLEALGDTDA